MSTVADGNDVYERSGGRTTLVSVSRRGRVGPFAATLSGASADGSHVFLTTRERLVAGDDDGGAPDVYEARARP